MNTKLIKRIFISTLGLTICGLGVGIFIHSNLGVDPASVFQQGLANIFNIQYGQASAMLNIAILIIIFIIDKKYINISSFLAIFLIGYTAQFFSAWLSTLINFDLHIALRILMLLIGCGVMATGIPIYIRADLGVGAIDLVSEVSSDKLKLNYQYVRVFTDSFFLIVGYILGGTFGIGTVIAVFLTGPTVQFVRPFTNKLVDNFLK